MRMLSSINYLNDISTNITCLCRPGSKVPKATEHQAPLDLRDC